MFTQKKCLRRIELRNTDKITTIINGFSNSLALREVILGNLSSCDNAKQSFYNDTSLEKITFGNCERIQDWTETFYGCISLKEIDATLNLGAVNWVPNTFANRTSLKSVRFEKETIKIGISLSSCKSLSKESMESLFDGLAISQGGTVTLSRYAYENNYPTDDEKKKIENRLTEKGWKLILE